LNFLITPFFDINPLQIIKNILNGIINFSVIEDVYLRKFMQTLLNNKKRPNSYKDIKKISKLKYLED